MVNISRHFSKTDKVFMDIALDEACIAAGVGNHPIGAVLVANGEVVGRAHNQKERRKDRISHAEMLLFIKSSKRLFRLKTLKNASLELFTTFEPCLMCLGVAVMHRVDRIVVACRDPRGNMSNMEPNRLGEWYRLNWPRLEYGLRFPESHRLLLDFFQTRGDEEGMKACKLIKQLKSTV
jgi:tRNA(adenine34) deaminase